MPNYEKKRARPRRRYRRRKKRYGTRGKNRSIISYKTSSPLPKLFKAPFRYREFAIDLNPGIGGTAATHVFSANSLYDPNQTGVGHQPSGFDQLMLMYDHYVVIGAKIHVTFTPKTSQQAHVVGVTLRDSNSLELDSRVLIEAGNTKHAILGATNTNVGTRPRTITYQCNPNKFMGRSKPLSDPQLKGSASSNPTEGAFFHVWAQPADGSTDSSGVEAVVDIEYVAILLEPKPVGLS